MSFNSSFFYVAFKGGGRYALHMKKVLGVITARGGSKGVPGKNIKILAGKPLIAWTIEAAKKSGVIDRLILSTDDEAIATVAREYGCEVPFMRPLDLATDTAGHLPVMQHAVNWMRDNEHYTPDFVMILQPTSPFRQPYHIKDAVGLIENSDADSVLSVLPVEEKYNPAKVMVLRNDGVLRLVSGEPIYKRIARRQDLPPAYASASLLYLFRPDLLNHPEKPNFYGEKTLPYVVDDAKYTVDINTPTDWELAERMVDGILINQ